MNIMEITSGTEMNGAVQHCHLLCRALARRGNRVTLVCRPGAWIGDQFADGSVEVIRSDLHRIPFDELRRIAAVVRQRRIEVVHTHMSRAHFFGVLLRWFSGVPCAATAHSRYIQVHWMFNDLVIAVSEATRRFHRRWNLVGARRIETIHNFIDPDRLNPMPADARAEVRAEWGVEASWPLVGAVGNVIPRKGLIYLVRALPEVLSAVPEARLVIVGREISRSYLARLKSLADEIGVASRIVWAGHRTDVPRVLAALDLCVLASLEESLPLTLLEAMAAGLPVVATAVGGVPECIRPGQTGLLVRPGNSGELARAIVHLLSDPAQRRALGDAGAVWVREQFSPEAQTARIEAALARVARPAA
ncbi:MAG: glycosyltransferase family 4 protein [Thermoguttaceae bacterium]|jgi:glycosyltransferase involved in cell wall biosynthesis|nr:glycosyltransferase family 4 protein [Thermoguttaceae bacterium]